MKILPAEFIVGRALRSGRLDEHGLLLESTSGTFGLALGMVAGPRGIPLTLVSDPAIDPQLQRRLEALGARVEIVAEPALEGGYQRARLDRLEELLAERPDAFCPSQYDNPDHPLAYAPFAELVVETLGSVDCLVGPVGSGGSMCGTGSFLRLVCPDVSLVAVDTHGSVLFGHQDAHRVLRGLGNSLMPRNLDHSMFEEVHWVAPAEAFRATHELFRRHALYMGPTSGAAYMVGEWWSRQHPDATTLIVLPDEGHRYRDTVYDADWLRGQGFDTADASEPRPVGAPAEAAGSSWASFRWGGRTLDQVMTATAAPATG